MYNDVSKLREYQEQYKEVCERLNSINLENILCGYFIEVTYHKKLHPRNEEFLRKLIQIIKGKSYFKKNFEEEFCKLGKKLDEYFKLENLRLELNSKIHEEKFELKIK